MRPNRVLFLDRDGTINVDMGPNYLNDPKDARLIPNVGRALCEAKFQHGFKIAIITNQAGVAKGLTPKEALPKIHDKLAQLIAADGDCEEFSFDDIQVCMHHPKEACLCRKPQTKNLLHSIQSLNADLKHSYFIGDKDSDLECAARVGLKSILVLTGHGQQTLSEIESGKVSVSKPVAFVAKDLLAAWHWICSQL